MSAMNKFPIVFRFRDIIAGTGFLARVQVDGRALLVVEDDGDQWVFGVQPGSVAGGASDAATALNEFKTRYQSVLFDIAGEAKTFDEFEREVRAFFDSSDAADDAEWAAALAAVRQTNAKLDELPSVKAETVPSRISVTLVENQSAQPALNELNQMARAA